MTIPRTDPAAPPATRPGLAWSWNDAARGALCAVPPAIVAAHDPARGLAFAVGALPVAVVGLDPSRCRRPAIVAVGAAAGLALMLGALLAEVGWFAVAGVFVVCLTVVVLAARRRLGPLGMALCFPLMGVGLGESPHAAAVAAVMIATGSAYCCVVSLLWPERPAVPAPRRPPMTPHDVLAHGLRLACAGAAATAVGLAWAPAYPGWPLAAALLAMRPAPETESRKLRGQGRLPAVLVGGLAAGSLARVGPPGAGYALALLAALAVAAAIQRSRWCVLPAFPAFIVLLFLAVGDPGDARARFDERMLATAVGVGLAAVFGWGGRRRVRRPLPTPRGRRPSPRRR